ncbi:MAG: hypothetical protein PHE50_06615 [Dehalococcoidales bacterium]|nr:hypothetical protein [Dehalococcoidales bacterium]
MAEKLERKPDILRKKYPLQDVTWELLSDEKESNRFNAMWKRLTLKIADKINSLIPCITMIHLQKRLVVYARVPTISVYQEK